MSAARPLPRSLRVLGIMSGTSLDGVDGALCAVGDRGIRLLDVWSAKFPRALRARLRRCAAGESSSWELAQLHHDLGRFYAECCQAQPVARCAHLVGLHGQTVFHHPHPGHPATLQIGEPAYLAEALRVPVISNFRAADVAAGGQGAPLATLFHQTVFSQRGQHVCVNNLGGISNVTSLDWRRGPQPRVLAFDTGPANVLLDLAATHWSRGRHACDTDGRWAARGEVDDALLREWLRHPFFRQAPPKSTGREMFGEPFWQRAHSRMKSRRLTRQDALATLTALTAQSLALNYQRHLPAAPDTVILTGGGAANPTLVQAIRQALTALRPEIAVRTGLEFGWPHHAIEPAAFALLAWRRWHGLPGNLAGTTGARRDVWCGQITQVR